MAYNYCGGIPQFAKSDLLNVIAFPNYIEVGGVFKKVKIPMESIKNISIKSEEQISKDVTLTRLLALGIFAFGAKKKTKHVSNYLIIEYVDSGMDCTAIFTGDKIAKLNSQIFKMRQRFLKRNPPNETSQESGDNIDVYEEIERLHSLLGKGIVSEEEFAAKKQQLLNI